MPKKLLMSLTLTPLTDRFLYMIFAIPARVVLEANQAAQIITPTDDDIFDTPESLQEQLDPMDESGGKSGPHERKKSVDKLIILFKSTMIVGIYVYSSWVKMFREKNRNFDEQEKGLSKIIDSMISKIV